MTQVTLPTAPPSLLHAFLDVCERTPDKPCVLFAGRSYSYAQLYHAAADWADRLTSPGMSGTVVESGDRVGLYLGNSPEFLAAYLGTYMVEGIVVLINIQYRQYELRHILNDAGVTLCITDRERLPELERVRADVDTLQSVLLATDDGHLQAVDAAEIAGLEIVRPATMPRPDDIALLGYTSGTTGRSKGAMLTHGNLASNSNAVTTVWHWTADDVLLLTLPLFHIHGLGVGIHGTWLKGATVDLRPHFAAAEVFDTLLRGDVTMFFGVPTMYTRLLAEARQRDQSPPPIRLYVSGSAPLDPQTFADFAQRFGLHILERYGMTETVMNLTNPYEGERRPGTVGQPFPGQEARIVNMQTRHPVPDDTVGEIQVRGPHVCQGYWQRPDATAEVFDADGWFSTGDLGWHSTDGYVTISGRAKELIISGGYNIYPREVEEVLLTHPGVSEVAVVGLPDADLGEQVVAAVVSTTSNAPTTETLIEQCRAHLAAYKKPRRVVFVDALPRNTLGKVQKHLLREQLSKE